MTHEDICSAFSGDTLLAVVAPAGTQLEVPLPEMVWTLFKTNLKKKIFFLALESYSAL